MPASQCLAALGKITREHPSAVVTHYNILPAIDLYATTQGRDLGAVAGDIRRSSTAEARYAEGRNGRAARPGHRP